MSDDAHFVAIALYSLHIDNVKGPTEKIGVRHFAEQLVSLLKRIVLRHFGYLINDRQNVLRLVDIVRTRLS